MIDTRCWSLWQIIQAICLNITYVLEISVLSIEWYLVTQSNKLITFQTENCVTYIRKCRTLKYINFILTFVHIFHSVIFAQNFLQLYLHILFVSKVKQFFFLNTKQYLNNNYIYYYQKLPLNHHPKILKLTTSILNNQSKTPKKLQHKLSTLQTYTQTNFNP